MSGSNEGYQSYETTQRRSFDPLASIYLLRADNSYESQTQVANEEFSLIAEGINLPIHTTFKIEQVGGQYCYFYKGEWRPYSDVSSTGRFIAETEAFLDPRKSFMVTRAAHEETEGAKLDSLRPGESIVLCSPYVIEAEEDYGADFVKKLGFWPERKMGFIRISQKQSDGSVLVISHSVDNSNLGAFAAIQKHLGNPVPQDLTSYDFLGYHTVVDEDIDISELLEIYDDYLHRLTNNEYIAGRLIKDGLAENNAWDEILKHRELLDYYLSEIQILADSHDLNSYELERMKKELTYGVWAAMAKRIEYDFVGEASGHNPMQFADRRSEVEYRFNEAVANYKYMIACGGMIGPEDMLDADPSKVFDLIFGKETYSFNRYMYCAVCQAQPEKKEKKKWCGPCGLCRKCDHSARRPKAAAISS